MTQNSMRSNAPEEGNCCLYLFHPLTIDNIILPFRTDVSAVQFSSNALIQQTPL